ncbi:MAG: carboxypeptidase-like regulatory domain-containing protein [Planctomycetota bacterium]
MVRALIVGIAAIALVTALWLSLHPQRTDVDVQVAPIEVAPESDVAEQLSTEASRDDALSERATIDAVPSTAPRTDDAAVPLAALRFRGRVVDVATGEPVRAALAVCGDLVATTDADGRFASEATMPEGFEEIAFHSLGRASHIRSARRAELEWLGDEQGWLARIRIGPTFRFRVTGVPAQPAKRWRLRVVEMRANGDEHAWNWIGTVSDDPPWARYDNPQPTPPSGTEMRIEVVDDTASRRGSAPLTTIVGIHPGVLVVELDALHGAAVGRVVDELGRPWGKTLVVAIPRDAGTSNESSRSTARTKADGRYVLSALRPGRHWIEARPRRGEDPRVIALDVARGENVAPDIVVPAEEYAGAVEGLLQSASATFPATVVRLRAVDGRSFDHFDVVDPNRQTRMQVVVHDGRIVRDPRVAMEPKGFFEFPQVPAGEYELSVLSSDGRAWSPSPLRVRPPKLDLELVRDDGASAWRAAFDVRDAGTKAPIEDAFAQFELGSCWSPETQPIVTGAGLRTFVAGTQLRWNVHAEGYTLASGTEHDFLGSDDLRIATVMLARGFGARLLLRDANRMFAATGDDTRGRCAVLEHAPVVGVPVYADGELAATTDARGEAVLALAHRPTRIDIRANGWIVLGSEHFRDGRIVGDTREAVVWLTRP